MAARTFNLTTEPWIKVIDQQSQTEKTVTLIDFFENAQHYQQLAGEMRAQDLAVLRFLLAILTTVYSRFDAQGEPYDWVEIDSESLQATAVDEDGYVSDDLLDTWQRLYETGHFSKIVTDYIERYADCFDLFGEQPFYQVTTDDYDALVPKNKRVAAGKGTVAVKQINRQISESGNTPAIFAPKSGTAKNDMPLDELARWLITYQNFTGVTDKTKIETTESFSTSMGWLYKLDPVFASGQSIFQTLMLNLILINGEQPYSLQKPVWEYEDIKDYIAQLKIQAQPTNLAALYTNWARLLHIQWDEKNQATIFSAGLPLFAPENAFIEPMTVWRWDKKESDYKPRRKRKETLAIAMWRNFGQYVNVSKADDVHEPGIVWWLHQLKNADLIARDTPLTLASVVLVSDGNATSQAPAAEVYDDMRLKADVLFDPDKGNYWPKRIEDAIEITQTIGKDYWLFVRNVGEIRNVNASGLAGQMSAKFYERLNGPFKNWLASLTNHDERDEKVRQWQQELRTIALASADDVVQTSSPRDIKGVDDNGPKNIFTVYNRFRYNVEVHLKKG